MLRIYKCGQPANPARLGTPRFYAIDDHRQTARRSSVQYRAEARDGPHSFEDRPFSV